MKALILVGGKATRLYPLAENIPKAMVPVLNIPFLEHVICHLGWHQIKEIILALGYQAEPFADYFGDGSRFGIRLSHVVEDTPRGTAGAIKNVQKYLDKTFLVLNGDIFTDLDITAMIDFHQKRKALATIALTPVDDPTSYGLVEADAQGRVTRFREKPSPTEVTTNMVNAGIYILEPEILTQIPPEVQVSIEREVFPRLVTQGKPVYAYSSADYWIDIGTPEKYLQLHRDLLSGKSRHYAPGEAVVIGEPSNIHPTAQIKAPVVIGANCTIGGGVKITGPVVIGGGGAILKESLIEGSVIWRNARLGPRVSIKNSILADNCCLNSGSICEESVLGDNVTVASGIKLEPGSRILPGTRVS